MINSKQAHSMKYGYDRELARSEAWREGLQRAGGGGPGQMELQGPRREGET